MARNRKRAKERRARRPQGASIGVPGRLERDAPPDPIEHAAPDVELAEAQLAVGRPELARDSDGEPVDDFDYEDEDLGENDSEADAVGAGGGDGGDADGSDEVFADGDRDGSSGGGELVAAGGATPSGQPSLRSANRLINFLQGSWRELQRVQWPDRRQVMQATGVVIGFVIVAGVFLGVADFLAGKLVNYILK